MEAGLLTSVSFKGRMLLLNVNSLQVQRWIATLLHPFWCFWWFSSSAWRAAPKILRLSHALRSRRALKALATSLWLCKDHFSMPRDGVNKVAGTLPSFWPMKHNSSSRSTWSRTRTGGLGWHLQPQTLRLMLHPPRVRLHAGGGRIDTAIFKDLYRFLLSLHVLRCYLYWPSWQICDNV